MTTKLSEIGAEIQRLRQHPFLRVPTASLDELQLFRKLDLQKQLEYLEAEKEAITDSISDSRSKV